MSGCCFHEHQGKLEWELLDIRSKINWLSSETLTDWICSLNSSNCWFTEENQLDLHHQQLIKQHWDHVMVHLIPTDRHNKQTNKPTPHYRQSWASQHEENQHVSEPIRSLSSPGVAVVVAAGGDEKPPNDGAMLFPLVRLPRPLKLPPFPKPEKAAGAEAALAAAAAAALAAKPLNPLKAPPPSAWNNTWT